MTLQDITVGQFQEIWKVNKSEIEPEEKMTEMVSILSGKTTNEVDSMPVLEFNKLAVQIKEMLSQPLPNVETPKMLCGYKMCYEPGKLNRGQYVTLMHFVKGDVVENCHYILATLAYDPVTNKHHAERHKEIAEELQEAKIVDVYAATVFFCDLFKASMRSLQSYLVSELLTKGATPKMAVEAITTLMEDLDGYLMPSKLQTSKV